MLRPRRGTPVERQAAHPTSGALLRVCFSTATAAVPPMMLTTSLLEQSTATRRNTLRAIVSNVSKSIRSGLSSPISAVMSASVGRLMRNRLHESRRNGSTNAIISRNGA